ncbi:MAG: hypothetical protein IPL71_24175 [Anaerolineales bacterium]|uniref:hypothetical protein n=1 Tax=Candidatus Villigracilis proximus TaxID=3140683 RepID=UPI0031367284|nr:hypothetical protein [Anaerolineales bacterium]
MPATTIEVLDKMKAGQKINPFRLKSECEFLHQKIEENRAADWPGIGAVLKKEKSETESPKKAEKSRKRHKKENDSFVPESVEQTNTNHMPTKFFFTIQYVWYEYNTLQWHYSLITGIESMLVASMSRAGRLRQSVLKSAFEGRLV